MVHRVQERGLSDFRAILDRLERGRTSHYLLFWIPIVVVWSIFVYMGWLGIDFGNHWDEGKLILAVRHSLDTGILLPGWYKYPSVSYWLTLFTTIPHSVAASQTARGWQEVVDHLRLVIQTPAFRLQAREVFLLVSSLASLWIYLAMRARQGKWLAGLFAAALLGFSWEICYHARWMAPDTILMQFAALVIFLLTLASEHPGKWKWNVLAALAAGLGAGTKYPGALLLVPVLIVTFQNLPAQSVWRKLGRTILDVAPMFLLGYLVSTPGTLLEPIGFFKDIRYEVWHYQTGVYEQNVTPGLPHLMLIFNYFARSLFSPYQISAVLFFLLSVLGMVVIIRRAPRMALWMLSFPLVYILFFSAQSILVVRNLLAVAPFLAVLAAWGAGEVAALLKPGLMRWGWFALLLFGLALNGLWIYNAARSISTRAPEKSLVQFLDYATKRQATVFSVSEKAWDILAALGRPMPQNVVRFVDGQTNDVLVVYMSEVVRRPQDWPIQSLGLIRRVFGPLEVNLNYYPLWAGDDHLLVLDGAWARRYGLTPAH